MTRRILRRIAIAALIGLGLVVFVLAGALFWVRSEGGRAWLTAELNRLLASPDQRITLAGLSGDLPFHWRIGHIEIADRDGAWLDLADAALDLDPAALLRGTARIEVLSAGRTDVLRMPEAAPNPPAQPSPSASAGVPELPRLPVGVELERLAIGRIQLAPAVVGEAVGLSVDGKAELHAGRASAQLAIERVDGQAGHVELSLDYAGPAR